MKKNTITVVIWTATVMGAMVGLWNLMVIHDSAMQQAYEKYEACFERTYGMLPSTWYAERGELPECKN